MVFNDPSITGLNNRQVAAARKKFGANRSQFKTPNGLTRALMSLVKEPMVMLLLVTSTIYFLSGKPGDGFYLAAAILLVAGISQFQDSRSRNALEKLKTFSQPLCKVFRDGKLQEINSEEIVPGDSLIVEEGTCITADGTIIQSHDFSVDESILTGESFPVSKNPTVGDHFAYQGTTVAGGLAVLRVTATGSRTRLGQIGRSLANMAEEQTPLELQINDFIRKMIVAGSLVFLVVWAINYAHSTNILDSLIKALTLAMSVLPEEIPVAFTTFMALGAWRLMQMGIVVKQMKTVETLGSASVICTDKTGTITENRMTLAKLYSPALDCIHEANGKLLPPEQELIRLAMWASEPVPFDPMEVALHSAYAMLERPDERPAYQLSHEYPLSGKPPMMTHIFEAAGGQRVIAAKGAPEAFLAISNLTEKEKERLVETVGQLSADGYRVLGVGQALFAGKDFPATQQEFQFSFCGLVAFYDPPKANIAAVLEDFYRAGITVKIITGDHAATTQAIARQIGFRGAEQSISGDEVMNLSDKDLAEKAVSVQLFTRMYPEAKLRIINALKSQKSVVAMTGDGVNDGPALKAAHIGIAMGKKGTEIAKQAASLILLEDDLSKMVDAVAMGRRIYTNLKKAIQYIISIHIPIILTVFIPLALGWRYPNIFSPVHIIFLELIMGPTCSIVYEQEPLEKNAMFQAPRPFSKTFFTWNELATSVIQGMMIAIGTLLIYQYAVSRGSNEQLTRTMVFVCLITANITLTLVNRSFYNSLLTTARYQNPLVWVIIALTVFLTVVLIYIGPIAGFFGFRPLAAPELIYCLATGALSVGWYEAVKSQKRRKEVSIIANSDPHHS